jgi:hypothetical protein
MKYLLYLELIRLTSKIKFYEICENFHPANYDTWGEWRINTESKNTY